MDSKDDHRAGRDRSTDGKGESTSADDGLEAELRQLHDRYGDRLDIPDAWIDLARRIGRAYEGTDTRRHADALRSGNVRRP